MGKTGVREGKDSTSQRGLASASLASQWAGAVHRRLAKLPLGVSWDSGGSGGPSVHAQ